MIVRRARLSDLRTLDGFQQRLVAHERPFDPTIKKGKVHYYNLKKLLNSQKVHFLVAEIGDKVVGCGFGEIQKDVKWSKNKQIGYIGLMFVEGEHRGKRIGHLIVTTLLRWFKEKGVFDVRLKVYEKNIGAVKAYQKYGFKNFVIEMRCTLD